MSKPSKNILLAVTGSVAAYKSAELVSLWKKAGHSVRIILTPAAKNFIGPTTFSGLTGEDPWSDVFEAGRTMDHIHLTRWADLFVIAPATANVIGKLAQGLADDLLTTTFLAFPREKPIYLAPAMNSKMWTHPAVQNNIQILQKYGVEIIQPGIGLLACNDIGPGRMAEPTEIDAQIFHRAYKGNLLITFGGTKEAIDGVRAITNSSTGKTGSELADYFYHNGFDVTCLAAANAIQPRSALRTLSFESFSELFQKMQQLLKNESFDYVIHCAAVSDYSVDEIATDSSIQKPDTSIKMGTEKSITIRLKQNPKILSLISQWAKAPLKSLVAFKLTNTKDLIQRNEAIEKLMRVRGVTQVVHNDLNEISGDRTQHPFTLYQQAAFELRCEGTLALGKALEELFLKAQNDKPTPTFSLGAENDFMS